MDTSIYDRIFQLSHCIDSPELIASRKTFIDTSCDYGTVRLDAAKDLISEAILRNLRDIHLLMVLYGELQGESPEDYPLEDCRRVGDFIALSEISLSKLGKIARASK